MTILLADIHGFLDNLKAPLELVMYRAEFYRHVLTAMLQAIGVPTEKLRVVLGSSYQKSPDYVMDVYKMASLISEHDAKKAGAEVVKQTDNAPMSGLLYPILQVLDEQYLDCDAQFGGVLSPEPRSQVPPSAIQTDLAQAWTSGNSSPPRRSGCQSSDTESARICSTPWCQACTVAR